MFSCPAYDHEVFEHPICCKIGDRHCATCKGHQQLVYNGVFLNDVKFFSDKKYNNGGKVEKLAKDFQH